MLWIFCIWAKIWSTFDFVFHIRQKYLFWRNNLSSLFECKYLSSFYCCFCSVALKVIIIFTFKTTYRIRVIIKNLELNLRIFTNFFIKIKISNKLIILSKILDLLHEHMVSIGSSYLHLRLDCLFVNSRLQMSSYKSWLISTRILAIHFSKF